MLVARSWPSAIIITRSPMYMRYRYIDSNFSLVTWLFVQAGIKPPVKQNTLSPRGTYSISMCPVAFCFNTGWTPEQLSLPDWLQRFSGPHFMVWYLLVSIWDNITTTVWWYLGNAGLTYYWQSTFAEFIAYRQAGHFWCSEMCCLT